MHLATAVFFGLIFALCLFLGLAIWFVPGFYEGLHRRLRMRGILALVVTLAFGAIFAVTQIDLTTQVKGVLPATNGGTASQFFSVAGPTAGRTFTFPDASATVLTTNSAVTVGQGGTGATSFAAHGTLVGEGTGAIVVAGPGTSGNCYMSNGAAADPTFQTCPGVLNFADAETPSGSINGSNTSFTLAHTPSPTASLNLFRNGVSQRSGAGNDYTISGSTITYLSAPLTGDTLVAWYRY